MRRCLFATVSLNGNDETGTIKPVHCNLKSFCTINEAIKQSSKKNWNGAIPVYINILSGFYNENVRLEDNIHITGTNVTIKKIIAKGNILASVRNIKIFVNNPKEGPFNIDKKASIIRENISVKYYYEENIRKRSNSLERLRRFFLK